MKLITRDTDYALRALCYMAKHGNTVISVRELSRSLGVPRPFLRKLLQSLTRRRVVASFKGWQGGFMLAQDARKICLTDLMEIFQGSSKSQGCLVKKKPCPRIPYCPLRTKLGAIEHDLTAKLRTLTIASLARSFAAAGFYGEKK